MTLIFGSWPKRSLSFLRTLFSTQCAIQHEYSYCQHDRAEKGRSKSMTCPAFVPYPFHHENKMVVTMGSVNRSSLTQKPNFGSPRLRCSLGATHGTFQSQVLGLIYIMAGLTIYCCASLAFGSLSIPFRLSISLNTCPYHCSKLILHSLKAS